MRNLRLLDQYRVRNPEVAAYYGGYGDHETGVFAVPSRIDSATLAVIASSGFGWEHVSVSRHNRCPNWLEMDHIKRLFFKEDETVMQLHVPDTEHINVHPNCLHLWRPTTQEIPRPPGWMVGGTPPPPEELARLEKETHERLNADNRAGADQEGA